MKVKGIFSILTSIVTVALFAVSIAMSPTLDYMLYSFWAGAFLAVISLFMIVAKGAELRSGKVSTPCALFKFMATSMATMSLVFTAGYLVPVIEWNGQYEGASLILSVVMPALAIFSYIILDSFQMNKWQVLLGVLPTVIYGGVYLAGGYLQKWDDFYRLNLDGRTWYTSSFILVVGAALLSIVIATLSEIFMPRKKLVASADTVESVEAEEEPKENAAETAEAAKTAETLEDPAEEKPEEFEAEVYEITEEPKTETAPKAEESVEVASVTEEPEAVHEEVKEEPKLETSAESAPKAEKPAAKKAPAKKAPAKKSEPAKKPEATKKSEPAKKAETVKKPETSKKAPAKKPNEDNKYKGKSRAYHVSKHPSGGWQVKLANGERAIKKFATQEEAITFANGLVKTQGGSRHVHSKTGKIRKD